MSLSSIHRRGADERWPKASAPPGIPFLICRIEVVKGPLKSPSRLSSQVEAYRETTHRGTIAEAQLLHESFISRLQAGVGNRAALRRAKVFPGLPGLLFRPRLSPEIPHCWRWRRWRCRRRFRDIQVLDGPRHAVLPARDSVSSFVDPSVSGVRHRPVSLVWQVLDSALLRHERISGVQQGRHCRRTTNALIAAACIYLPRAEDW